MGTSWREQMTTKKGLKIVNLWQCSVWRKVCLWQMGPHNAPRTHTLHTQGRTEEISPATWKVETLLWKFHQRSYEESTFKEQTSKELPEIKKNIILCGTFWRKLMPSLQMDKPKKRLRETDNLQYYPCYLQSKLCNPPWAQKTKSRQIK